MSAFLVSKKHIDAIVSASDGFGRRSPAQMTNEGRMLLRQNMVSLAARYRDPVDEASIAAYVHQPVSLSPVQILKAISCYEYQACEDDGWETSAARRYCEDKRKAVVGSLPGYNEAAWGVD